MEIKTKNAVIENIFLGYGDHGFLTLSLTLDYGGSAQVFGNYDIRRNASFWIKRI